MSIWQKATIRDAFPDDYKDKRLAEYAKESHKNREGSGQTTEFDNTENRTFVQDSNLAESGSFGPIEGISENFSRMNRGQDVMTELERAKNLEPRLADAKEERSFLRQEREELNTTVKVLKEKTTSELLRSLQEKFSLG
jgi:hypothetical protein